MRSLGSLSLSVVVLASGAGGAYWFRKPAEFTLPLLHPSPSAAMNDFRAAPQSPLSNGPVAAPLLLHPVPRLLGRIQEEPPTTRPLGLAQELPPMLPETFISNNGAIDAPSLDGIEP